jgi:hypothetical protein
LELALVSEEEDPDEERAESLVTLSVSSPKKSAFGR